MLRKRIVENNLFVILNVFIMLICLVAFFLFANAFLTYDGLAYQNEFVAIGKSCFSESGWETFAYRLLTCSLLKITGSLYSVQIFQFIILFATLWVIYKEMTKFDKKATVALVVLSPFIVFPLYIFNLLITERDVLSALLVQMGVVLLFSLMKERDAKKEKKTYLAIGMFTLAALTRIENFFYILWIIFLITFVIKLERKKVLIAVMISIGINFIVNQIVPRMVTEEGLYSVKHKSHALILLYPLSHLISQNKIPLTIEKTKVIEKIIDPSHLIASSKDSDNHLVEAAYRINDYSFKEWLRLARLILETVTRNPLSYLKYQYIKFQSATSNEFNLKSVLAKNTELVDSSPEQAELRKRLGYLPISLNDKVLINIFDKMSRIPLFYFFKTKFVLLMLFALMIAFLIRKKLMNCWPLLRFSLILFLFY